MGHSVSSIVSPACVRSSVRVYDRSGLGVKLATLDSTRAPMVLTLARTSAILPAMRVLRSFTGGITLLVAVLLSTTSTGVIFAAGAHGCDPNDLIPNCDFNSFSGNMPSGFSPVIMSGQVNFAPARGGESHSASGDSLRLDSNGTYVAAIYTRVDGLQPGTAYKASLGFASGSVNASAYGRRLGMIRPAASIRTRRRSSGAWIIGATASI